jgi:predicted metal-dependent HD superfamily phosphohydrolase
MDRARAESHILAKLRAGLSPHRTYHSFEHTVDVHRTAMAIAASEHVVGEDLDLLRTAAVYHDSGFLLQDREHEMASCLLAHQDLPGFGFTFPQIERVCFMIMATRVPQEPKDGLSRILCDADLDYLGRDDFHRIGAELFKEFKYFGVLKTAREWNELQVRFLTKHRYFTATNKRIREPVKQMHLLEVKRWLLENP